MLPPPLAGPLSPALPTPLPETGALIAAAESGRPTPGPDSTKPDSWTGRTGQKGRRRGTGKCGPNR